MSLDEAFFGSSEVIGNSDVYLEDGLVEVKDGIAEIMLRSLRGDGKVRTLPRGYKMGLLSSVLDVEVEEERQVLLVGDPVDPLEGIKLDHLS